MAAILELRAVSVYVMLPLAAVLVACAGAALLSGVRRAEESPFMCPRWHRNGTRIDPHRRIFRNLVSVRAAARLGEDPGSGRGTGDFGLAQADEPGRRFRCSAWLRLPGVLKDSYDLLVDAAWILFVWSALDYAVEWRSWSERLKMSRQELRDEYRETEGNPQVRGRIRNLQRQMRARMIRADVARASVVITNPTHYAVALSFDFETMDAPRVLVKGRNLRGRADQGRGALGGGADRRKPAAGAVALPDGRGRTGHPLRALCGGGRHSRLSISPAGGGADSPAAGGAGEGGGGCCVGEIRPSFRRAANVSSGDAEFSKRAPNATGIRRRERASSASNGRGRKKTNEGA